MRNLRTWHKGCDGQVHCYCLILAHTVVQEPVILQRVPFQGESPLQNYQNTCVTIFRGANFMKFTRVPKCHTPGVVTNSYETESTFIIKYCQKIILRIIQNHQNFHMNSNMTS